MSSGRDLRGVRLLHWWRKLSSEKQVLGPSGAFVRLCKKEKVPIIF